MATKVKWRGVARFRGQVAKLPRAVALACRAAMEESAQEMVDAARRLVPVESGRLRDSINWCWGNPPAGSSSILSIGAPRAAKDKGVSDSRISIFAGDGDAFYARFVEFGTHSRPAGAYRDAKGRRRKGGVHSHPGGVAHPFFYPTWRSLKKRMRSRITRRVNAAIKKLAKEGGG